jgi:hypothetical protein
MNTKLTLRLDDELIRGAKRHAAGSGTTVSRLVADYFALLTADEKPPVAELTPRVRSLFGSLAGSGVEEGDYRRHLEDTYR